MRHAERADTAFPPDPWVESPEAVAWPQDPPATERGLQDARAVSFREVAKPAATAAAASRASGEAIGVDPGAGWVVVSSPYLRCIQTAVQVCIVLGPGSRLLVDKELGEVYGPEVMGRREPQNVVRPMQDIHDYCKAQGVFLRADAVGSWPRWPESLQQARSRLMRRFLQYMRRSALTRRSFVLVTHADGVAAALAAMPVANGQSIEEVDYCGLFMAEAKAGEPTPRLELSSVVPANCGQDSEELPGNEDEAELVVPGCGWKVRRHGIKLKQRNPRNFRERLRGLARRTGYSESELASLLRFLPEQTLSEASEEDPTFRIFLPQQTDQPLQDIRSVCSYSTYLFGASEIASPWTSPSPSENGVMVPHAAPRSRSPTVTVTDMRRIARVSGISGHSGGSRTSVSSNTNEHSASNRTSTSSSEALHHAIPGDGGHSATKAPEGDAAAADRSTRTPRLLLPVGHTLGGSSSHCSLANAQLLCVEEVGKQLESGNNTASSAGSTACNSWNMLTANQRVGSASAPASPAASLPVGGGSHTEPNSPSNFSPVVCSTLLQRRNRTPMALLIKKPSSALPAGEQGAGSFEQSETGPVAGGGVPA